jgi:hypothetical protein
MTTKNQSEMAGGGLIELVYRLPWLEILSEVWKVSRRLWRGMADEGMYEVVNYESTLELQDKAGRRANLRKHQKVRYLQNNIIAYQDQAWGDGEILIDYSCSPGKVVDCYRPGQKTFLLISLRETKQRGDVDEFDIEWRITDGFTRSSELWETEIRHRTKRLKVEVIFPKSRPPLRLWIVEQLRRRRQQLDHDARRQLSDGRWLATWETESPRLNERYQLQWEW